MLVNRLDEIRLLITLHNEDLNALNLNFDMITLNKNKSSHTIKEIIALSLVKIDLHLKNSKLSVSAIPFDKGCYLLVTVHEHNERKVFRIKRTEENTIVHVSSTETLLNIIKYLYNTAFPCKSTLYISPDNEYYMLIKSVQKLSYSQSCYFSEFCATIRYDPITVARIEEHCRILRYGDAINYIGSML